MKHLFLVRHADYHEIETRLDDEKINLRGIEQIRLLSEEMKKVLGGNSTYLISSTAPRAMDSARFLLQYLGRDQEFESEPFLWTDSFNPSKHYTGKPEGVMEIIQRSEGRAENLILVSHYELLQFFPFHFASEILGRSLEDYDGVERGQAIHFNLEDKTYQKIPKFR